MTAGIAEAPEQAEIQRVRLALHQMGAGTAIHVRHRRYLVADCAAYGRGAQHKLRRRLAIERLLEVAGGGLRRQGRSEWAESLAKLDLCVYHIPGLATPGIGQ